MEERLAQAINFRLSLLSAKIDEIDRLRQEQETLEHQLSRSRIESDRLKDKVKKLIDEINSLRLGCMSDSTWNQRANTSEENFNDLTTQQFA